MKKVLSIVLSLVLVICMMPVMAFAGTNDAAYNDIAGEKCEGAVNVLSALGVVDGYENGTYKPEQTVTRAEMAKLVITALGMDSYATATKSSYSDMANAQWAIPVVEYATNLGIIEGVGGGRFSPGNPLTYEQAATMIVRAIGFTTACNEMNGTWPAIYVQKATALGLFENVEGNNYGTGANRGDVAIMLYNALNTPMVYADKDGQTLEKTGKDGGKITMMTTLNKNGTAVYGVLTPEDADTALTNVRSLIGAAGKIIKNKDGKVLSIGDIQTQFLTGEYNGEKFVVGDTEYTIAPKAYTNYAAEGKVTPGTNNDSDTVPAFKNNSTDGVKNLSAVEKKTVTIAVKVSGKTIKNIYSISYWDATTGDAKQVTSSQLKKITSDKSLLGYKFPKNDDTEIDMNAFALLGVDSLDKIAADNIVAVYANSDNVITKVEVGTEVVTDKVAKVKTNDDVYKTVYTVGDKEYKASKLLTEADAKALVNTLTAGAEVKMFLDYSGKIYKAEVVEDTYLYGVALKAADTGNSYDDTDYMIKVMQADGKAAVLKIKNKATFDNITTGKVNEGQLVRYKVNSDNQVTEMTVATAKTSAKTEYNNGVLDGKLCADDMVVFVYNGQGVADADNYKVVKASALTGDIAKDTFIFQNSKDEITAIKVGDAATSAVDTFGFVNSKSSVMNDKDEVVFEIVGVADGKELNAKTEPTGTYEFDNKTFMKFDMSGDVIDRITAAKLAEKDNVLSEADFTADKANDAVMFKSGTPYGTVGNLMVYKTTADCNGSSVEVDGVNRVIKDAKVYKATLNSDKAFAGWEIAEVTDIEEEGYVALLQTSKKSSNWDTVVYIPYEVNRDNKDIILTTVVKTDTTVKAAVKDAKEGTLVNNYNAVGDFDVDGTNVKVVYTLDQDPFTPNETVDQRTAPAVADLARFLGTLYDEGNGVETITFNGGTYKWNTAGLLKGSNYQLNGDGATLVSVITTRYLTGTSANSVTIPLTLDGVAYNYVISVKLSE